MKKLLLIFTIISTLSLISMEYQTLQHESFSNKLFVQTVLSGSHEAIDFFIQEHKKTYLDVLKVCAMEDDGTAVDYALSKTLLQKPMMPEPLFEHFKKEKMHEAKWLCQIVPTSTYLEQNCSPCVEGVVMVLCSPWILCSDIFSRLTAPGMTFEVQQMNNTYQQEYALYKNAKTACSDIYKQALNNNKQVFMNAYKNHKNKKLEKVENAFNELI